MKKNDQKKETGFRFNVWLMLSCLLLSILIWAATLYIEDPHGLREGESAAVAFAVAEEHL